MTRGQLEHAIRAACEVAHDTEVIVFGSQSILGQFPDAPDELLVSIEADIMPRNNQDQTGMVDGALGQDSQFHKAHGFYVHGVAIEAATLAPGWERRAVRVQNANTRGHVGLCLEAHDLAASKLAAFREKDRDFVRILLVHDMIRGNRLIRVVNILPVVDETKVRLRIWVERTEKELLPGGGTK